VVPEFDTPGHTASVGQAYPDLIADCYDWLKSTNEGDLRWPMFNNVALDVTKPETKVFVKNIIEEMSALFTDDFFHIGGDEVDQDCWSAVPSILTWMQQHDFASYNASSQEWSYDFTGLQGSWATFAQVSSAQFTASVSLFSPLVSSPVLCCVVLCCAVTVGRDTSLFICVYVCVYVCVCVCL
jgi:hypothetical protein